MKKVVSIMAVAALFLSMNVNAQEPKAKKKKAKTEAAAATSEPSVEKKSCAPGTFKKGCCAHKEEAKS